jgi:hypothetical protein
MTQVVEIDGVLSSIIDIQRPLENGSFAVGTHNSPLNNTFGV